MICDRRSSSLREQFNPHAFTIASLCWFRLHLLHNFIRPSSRSLKNRRFLL